MLLMQHQYLFLSVVQNTLTIDSLSVNLFIKKGISLRCLSAMLILLAQKISFLRSTTSNRK